MEIECPRLLSTDVPRSTPPTKPNQPFQILPPTKRPFIPHSEIRTPHSIRPFLHGPIFKPIREKRELFENVHIEGGTIAWSNGADIDPDVLYYNLKPAWIEEKGAA